MNAVNALAPGPGKTLVATDGSTTRPYRQWVHDLMERGRSGRVLVLDLASGSVAHARFRAGAMRSASAPAGRRRSSSAKAGGTA